jgi:hypothetical protein
MITDTHAWYDLPDHGRPMLRCLYELLTQVRDRLREDLAVILADQARPLGELLRASPALAARFPAVIDLPASRQSSTSPATPLTSSPPSSPPRRQKRGSRSPGCRM